MATSERFDLVKAVILPLIVAALLYLVLSFVLLPIYRRYRADITRYSQYAPLTSTLQSTTSIFSDYIPESLRPRSIREKLGDFFMRTIMPSMWALRDRGSNLRDGNDVERDSLSSDDDDGGLFDEESGEQMVGFDMNEGRRGRNNRHRPGTRGSRDNHAAHLAASNLDSQEQEASDRRLSRELEEGFRDDSESENSDEEVTVGRRRLSMAGNR